MATVKTDISNELSLSGTISKIVRGRIGVNVPVRVDDIVEALSSLGGTAHNSQIEAVVRRIAPSPLPGDVGAVIRARIQERTLEAKSYKGGVVLFESVHGVGARKGIWRLIGDPLSISNEDSFQDSVETVAEAEEWRAKLRIHLRRERSRKLVIEFKRSLPHFRCEICKFDFENFYGELGQGFIEAHHRIPVSELVDGQTTKITDLIALCANCHRMIHRNPALTVADLRSLISEE